MNIQPDITALLDKHLGSWADEQGIPVSWDNVEFTPPETGVYLQSHDLPATPYSIDLAGTCLVFPGVYQLNVIARAASGRTLAAQTAKNITALFPQNLELSGEGFTCWVLSLPSIHPGINNGVNWTVPVSLTYRAETIV
ncbi:TPA: phage tail terminator-like protein [Enterobacter ludwigii]